MCDTLCVWKKTGFKEQHTELRLQETSLAETYKMWVQFTVNHSNSLKFKIQAYIRISLAETYRMWVQFAVKFKASIRMSLCPASFENRSQA